MVAVNPASWHVGQSSAIVGCRQHLGFEATHLAGGGCLTIDGASADNLAHHRIEGQPVSIIDILVAGEATESRLT